MGRQGDTPFPGGPLLGNEWSNVNEKNQLNFLLPKFKLNSRALPKLEAVQLSLLSVLQLPQHVQVPAGTNRESLKCCQECWSRSLSVLTWSSYTLMRAPVLKRFSACFAKKTMKNTQTLVYLYKLTVYKLLEWTAAAGRILVLPTKSKVKLLLAEKGIALSAWRCFLNFCTQAWQWIRREIRR